MKPKQNNFAFIDSQNLYLAVKAMDWKIDYRRLRIYLKEKFQAQKAYMFVGYLCRNKKLYDYWKNCGYEIIFKPIVQNIDGKIKGNVDAELVLQAMIDYENYDKAVLITGDGDFHCLIKYLSQKGKMERLVVPDKYHYSVFLRRFTNSKIISFMNDLKNLLEYKNLRR